MKHTQLFLITGVNGIGKSTVIPELKKILSEAEYAVYDFDERGVPDNADQAWLESETKHWVQMAVENSTRNIATVVCGFMKASDIESALEDRPQIQVNVCVLDGHPEIITKRIMSRYTTPQSLVELERTTGKTPEKFIQDNVWVSSKFRKEAEENGYTLLDTNNLAPYEVANSVIGWISSIMRE